ncbi:membrane protein [Chromobacterium violaceum]|uniref:ABC transporter permease n=1 Tax=Chromobacterium violaceum TaxID=536 RepID=UPI0006539415|nr:ABC transporter permease [Chromobacterium violaceum]KMN49799.1 membrane protein [Chromobacterium violaceum]KMN87941.1 membrane protein [Chromobacterium violaceum]KMN88525.1 membrane protein [Chromobacterium violaceum]KMO05543.1 membrane protein [Chromobacterium violaceum]
MWQRLLWLIIKELQALAGNRQGRLLLVVPVLLQLLVFPFAATLEVKHASLAVYNQDAGAASQELVKRMAASATFDHMLPMRSYPELRDCIDRQCALLAVVFPQDFSRALAAGRSTSLQVIVDGRRSNSGQIASAYIGQMVAAYRQERAGPGPQLSVRNLYNPNLEFQWHVLPSLVAIITTIGCLIVTALSVAREREEGTFDQLLVSPLTPAYVMAGKAVPGVLVALLQGGLIAVAAAWAYRVPFDGSVALLLISMASYGLALAGVGLFISSICRTQQQAFLGVFSFMVPAVILSGYVSPIENMPDALQWLARINPLSYFIPILKGAFLKGYGFADAWPWLLPLWLIAAVTLSLALWCFRRHVE